MFCTGSAKYAVDLDLTFARRGLHDGGAGSAADPLEAPRVGEYAPEEITMMKYFSCDEALRGNP